MLLREGDIMNVETGVLPKGPQQHHTAAAQQSQSGSGIGGHALTTINPLLEFDEPNPDSGANGGLGPNRGAPAGSGLLPAKNPIGGKQIQLSDLGANGDGIIIDGRWSDIGLPVPSE